MKFSEVVAQTLAWLQREGRVSYRALKREFDLDDEFLEDVKAEIIEAKQLAMDENGKVLVWVGAALVSSSTLQVSGSHSPAPSTQLADARPEAERRQLTVLFCDLVGSTTLSALLDPEELREVVRAYHEMCAGVISRYEGHTAQHLGDGLLVYFGYPTAHEDDAQRAVRTGLEILAGLQPLNTRLQPTIRARLPHPIQVRIGVHTGLVVIGEVGSREKREVLALGETPNIAARIQGQAAPDEVVISVATYRLVEGLFVCEDRGQPELKGVPTPLTLYHVVKEGEARSRFEVVVRKGLTPLVGREHELGLLRERWERVKDGEGQVVLLSGEPGIGKSRLVEVLKDTVVHEGASCVELHCSPYHQNSALYPVIAHLQRLLHFQADETPENKLEKLQHILSRSRFPQADTLPLLAALLSLPHPEGCPPLSLSPQRQKEKTHEAVVAWLCEEAKQRAVTYAWEDLHWTDPSTLELLTLFLDQVPTTRLLAVLTFRPEFTPPWGSHSYLSQLTLSRLGRTQAEMMVERVTGGKALPAEVVQQIASKTDGVPLFVEELTKTVVESGLVREVEGHYELSRPLPSLAIPSTLQDSLMARLDRLATVREIAQIGATIGREFPYDLLQAVSPLDEETLQKGLRQLVEAELVYRSGVLPQARYLFKHALVQDTAYQSLLKNTRQQYHRQIAQVLEERFAETTETQPELLAHHYTGAGLKEQAIAYWHRAGERAIRRSANVEAIAHLTKGLELLKTLPDTPERTQHELTLQLALGAPLKATKGWAAPEVEQTYTRALELCRQVGETPQLFGVLGGLWVFYFDRAEYKTAHELAEQCLRLAQSVQNSYLLVWAHCVVGMTLFNLGEFALAQDHLEQGIARYDPQQHRALAFSAGTNEPGMTSLSEVALALWSLGYPDQALKRLHEALTLAQEVFHPLNLTFALANAALLHLLRREEQVTQERAEVLLALSSEQGFALFLAYGTILQGWALAEQGRGEEGIAQIHQGLVAQQATGAEGLRPHFLALLAEACGKVGQAEEGLSALSEALALVNKTGERFYEAELYRLKGELTLAQSSVQGLASSVQKEAEECFWKAIEIARRQSAKSLELRAATSLARLWRQQGKKDEAHALLAKIYGWFTEGFDTKDLQEAKTLLKELNH
jgi:class 3 adenylate cyclase/predicted ATPase